MWDETPITAWEEAQSWLLATILTSSCQSSACSEDLTPQVMLCFDPCSALFVSILPSTSLIFSSLFMSQCKLIHVDSVLKSVDFWDCVGLCVCVTVRVWCVTKEFMAAMWDLMWMAPPAYRACVSLLAECRHCKPPDISGLRLPWHCAQHTGAPGRLCREINPFLAPCSGFSLPVAL